MNNYIQIYRNVIAPEYCDELIKKFESNTNQYEKYERGSTSFTQINLNTNQNWTTDAFKLLNIYVKALERYKKDCVITKAMWPEKYAFEQIRLKRYLPNDKDSFDCHVDSADIKTAIRFLVFFIYLDDNEKGETSFPQLGEYSPCKKGSLLMFPPLWPWLHAGNKPINKPKYIIGSYLHYREDSEYD